MRVALKSTGRRLHDSRTGRDVELYTSKGEVVDLSEATEIRINPFTPSDVATVTVTFILTELGEAPAADGE